MEHLIVKLGIERWHVVRGAHCSVGGELYGFSYRQMKSRK